MTVFPFRNLITIQILHRTNFALIAVFFTYQIGFPIFPISFSLGQTVYTWQKTVVNLFHGGSLKLKLINNIKPSRTNYT